MHVAITKDERFDKIAVRRDDGSVIESRFAKKGPLPHDAVHFIVEDALGLTRAFWGMVAAGKNPEDIQEIAKAAGHASAKRARPPDPEIVELLQAERIVECFEARLWDGGKGDPEIFRAVAEAACGASFVPAPQLSDATIAAIDARVAALAREWVQGQCAFEWPTK